jgi:hypothetical protein
MVITTGISKSSCIAINSSPIPDKYRFLTTSFFSSGINFGWDSYALWLHYYSTYKFGLTWFSWIKENKRSWFLLITGERFSFRMLYWEFHTLVTKNASNLPRLWSRLKIFNHP